MKNTLILISVLFVISSCSEQEQKEPEIVSYEEEFVEKKFSILSENLTLEFDGIINECFNSKFLDSNMNSPGIFLFDFIGYEQDCQLQISLSGYVKKENLIGLEYYDQYLLAFYNEEYYKNCWIKYVNLDSVFQEIPNNVFQLDDPNLPPSDPFGWTYKLTKDSLRLIEMGFY